MASLLGLEGQLRELLGCVARKAWIGTSACEGSLFPSTLGRMASAKIPGPICHSRSPINIRDGTLARIAAPNPVPTGCDDPFPPASDALDLAHGLSVLDRDHVGKVEQVINWAIEQGTKRYRDERTGAVTGTRFQILVRALQILARHRNANEPTSLVHRDADHYLSARVTEPQLHYRK